MIGRTVSRYTVLSKLGSGGMGVVFEAEDAELGRRVAIKFLPEEAVRSPDALDRFKREARAASALNHPHICTVHDIGVHDGKPFLVMERCRGRRSSTRSSGKALSIEKVAALGEQIADALDAAHRAGIVHRDVKPANLFVTERGEAKVLDFGLAKVASSESGAGVTPDAPTVAGEHLTAFGTTIGTVAYMSPEQARGEPVDARSDLFSLGVVLYEMATGRLPFQGGEHGGVFRGDPEDGSDPAEPVESRDSSAARAGHPEVAREGSGDALPERGRHAGGPAAATPRHDVGPRLAARSRPAASTPAWHGRRGVWAGVGAVALALAAGAGLWMGRGTERSGNGRRHSIDRGLALGGPECPARPAVLR